MPLQAEILTSRKQAMLLKRQHTASEQKVSQLTRDIEFERFQKKGLQQLVATFASAPAGAFSVEEFSFPIEEC